MEIDAKQYARIAIGGLLVILETGSGKAGVRAFGRKASREDGEERPLKFRISCCSGTLIL